MLKGILGYIARTSLKTNERTDEQKGTQAGNLPPKFHRREGGLYLGPFGQNSGLF